MATPSPQDEQSRLVSDQLVQVLLVYADPANGSGLDDLRRSVSSGHYPWLERELAKCLREGVFTAQRWAEATGQTDTGLSEMVTAKQQQRLWHTVFAGKPYPAQEV